jgi:hypothetical protein
VRRSRGVFIPGLYYISWSNSREIQVGKGRRKPLTEEIDNNEVHK